MMRSARIFIRGAIARMTGCASSGKMLLPLLPPDGATRCRTIGWACNMVRVGVNLDLTESHYPKTDLRENLGSDVI